LKATYLVAPAVPVVIISARLLIISSLQIKPGVMPLSATAFCTRPEVVRTKALMLPTHCKNRPACYE